MRERARPADVRQSFSAGTLVHGIPGRLHTHVADRSLERAGPIARARALGERHAPPACRERHRTVSPTTICFRH